MALKPVAKEEFEKLVPEGFREHYVEKDGKFIPQVEGAVPESDLLAAKAKLAEFRDNNIRLMKKIDEELTPKLKQFEGVDLEEYKALKAGKEDLEKKGVKDSKDIEGLIGKHVSAAIKPLETRLEQSEKRRIDAERALEMREVDQTLSGAAIKAGIMPDVLSDVLERGRKVFKYQGGSVVALNGETPLYSTEKPEQPLTPDEWILSLPKPFFKPNAGSGAANEGKGAGRGVRILRNPTPMEMGRYAKEIASGEMAVQRD